jgi:opacity protein-like surface antigen
MKRFVLPAILAIFAVSFANAQDVFQKDDLVFNAGIGLNNSLYSGTGYKSTLPPISISGEYGVAENLINGDNGSIGVGGYLGYTSAEFKRSVLGTDFGWKYSSLIIGARGAFHYQLVDDLDTYASVMLGYNVVSAKSIGEENLALGKASASAFSSSFFLGARYWFTPGLGAFAELGYGISNVNIGVTFKM